MGKTDKTVKRDQPWSSKGPAAQAILRSLEDGTLNPFTTRYHHRLRDPGQAQIVFNFRFDLRYGPDLFSNLSKLELSRILEATFD